MRVIKTSIQLQDMRRRELMELASDGPMVRRFSEGDDSPYGYLPTKERLAIMTPLGHYKTKLLDMGLSIEVVIQKVYLQMINHGDNFAFRESDHEPIGSQMYDSLKRVVLGMIGSKKGQLRVYMDTFIF